jgi:FKBP-type peptidyl-prolyl cis-trans isomerase FkpA
MRKISTLLLLAVVAFSACKENYKKGEEGMQYKIINDGKGDLLKAGEFMEIHFSSILNGTGRKDSVLSSTREQGAPQIMPFDSTQLPPSYFKIFKQMRKGDSLSTKTIVDSMFKKEQAGNMPPFMKKGQYIITNIKIVNIYKTQADADKARTAGMAAMEVAAKAKADALAKEDDKTITNFLTKNNAKATKSAKGAYVEITTPGAGAVLDTNMFVKINYTGKTLAGIMFDSNTDPVKGHVEPLLVNLTNDPSLGNGVIPGMSEGLRMMQKGTKGKIYIPSGLGYGPRGAGGDIGPNCNLVFDIDVLEIVSKEQAKVEASLQQKKMMEKQKEMQAQQQAEQKRYMDSLQKADPKKAEEMKQQMQQQMMQQMQQQSQQGGGRGR